MWLSSLLDVGDIVVKHAAEDKLYMPLGSIGGSGVLSLPLRERDLPSASDESQLGAFALDTKATQYSTLHVFVANEWVGHAVA